ncbi:MAG TPA: MDR family MFS transporter [Dehalococcoidales bacterium]
MDNNSISPAAGSYSLSRRQVFWTLAGIMLAMLLGALDQTVVGTSMPRIVADLGGFNRYTWVTSIYMITSAVTIPLVGKLSDMYGRKILYMTGIAIFVTFSLACGLSQNMTELIVFRGIQGIGGGVLMTLAFIAIADLFPPSERGKYQGLLTIVFSFASVIGPTTGGYLTDNISWHWVFFINVPIGIAVIAIFFKFFPNLRTVNLKHIIDYPGLCALILTVVPIMLALSFGGVQYAWGSVQIIGMFVFAAVMLGLFLFLENRSPEPILPLSLFKNRIVAISNLVSFLTGMGMFASITFIPLYLQGVLGASATASGNMQIPQSIAVMLTAFLAGQLISRAKGQYRNLGALAMGLICLGVFLLSRLTTGSAFWMVIVDAIIIGFGMGFSIPVFTIAIQNSVPREILGVATSSSTFLRSFGGAIGLAVLGSIVNVRFLANFTSHLPATVTNAVSMEKLSALAHNPQALVNPTAQAQLKEILSSAGLGSSVFDQVMQTLKQALSSAIAEAFLIGFGILMIGLVATLFLKQGPANKDDRPVNILNGQNPEK